MAASNGGSVAQQATDGATPLLAAVLDGHLEVVRWLASNGGSVAQPDNAGCTAVAAATRYGHDSVIAFLTAASLWSAFKILVACRLADDAKAHAPLRPARSLSAPSPAPHSSLPVRARRTGRTQVGLARHLPGHAPACPRRHRALDAVSALSVPRWGSHPHPHGDVVRQPGSEPGPRPDRAVAADLQLLPPVGLGGAGCLAISVRLMSQAQSRMPAPSPSRS